MAAWPARCRGLQRLFVIATLAMIGLPMLNGFVGEFLILSSTFTGVSHGWAIAAAVGAILGAAYMLWLVQRLFYGPESELAPLKASGRSAPGRTGRPVAARCPDAGDGPRAVALDSNHREPHRHTRRDKGSTVLPETSLRDSDARGGAAVNPVPSILRILPEVILTLTGVLVMLIDASLPPRLPRRGLGWVAAIGTTLALWASLWQLSLPAGTGFYATVETSPFTVFFHVLICGIVLVALLLALDTLPEDSHHQGEFYALIVFGAVGMCLLTGAVELLLVFIALEISSISTYVLAGYRKETGRGPEAAIKYFLLGSFATAFLLYGIALVFGATGTTQIYEIAHKLASGQSSSLVLAALALMLVGILFKVSAAPFHVWTPDVYEGAPSPVVALLSTAPKAAAFALLLRVVYEMFPTLRSVWEPLLWVVAVLSMTVGNLAALRQQNVKRMLAYSSIAHAGYLLAAFAGLGSSGIAAASFYTAAYAAMNVGIFAVITLASGYDEELPTDPGLPRAHLPLPLAGQPADLLPRLAGRNSLYRRIFRQVLFVLGRGKRRRGMARHHRPSELRTGCGLLPALRLRLSPAPGRAQRPRVRPRLRTSELLWAQLCSSPPRPRWSWASCPGDVLHASQAGAHTLQTPPDTSAPPGDYGNGSAESIAATWRLCSWNEELSRLS